MANSKPSGTNSVIKCAIKYVCMHVCSELSTYPLFRATYKTMATGISCVLIELSLSKVLPNTNTVTATFSNVDYLRCQLGVTTDELTVLCGPNEYCCIPSLFYRIQCCIS